MRRSIKKVAAGLLATMMIGTMLTGCGGGNKKDSGSSKKETSEINIGFSQVGAESDWRVANTKSMKSALTAKNGFKLSFADAQQKQENQTKAVREFITQGVDVIAIAPVTETGWETVLKEAKKADIPVITVDRQIKTSDDSLITAWVGSDFKKEGVKAAEWLIKEMIVTSLPGVFPAAFNASIAPNAMLSFCATTTSMSLFCFKKDSITS